MITTNYNNMKKMNDNRKPIKSIIVEIIQNLYIKNKLSQKQYVKINVVLCNFFDFIMVVCIIFMSFYVTIIFALSFCYISSIFPLISFPENVTHYWHPLGPGSKTLLAPITYSFSVIFKFPGHCVQSRSLTSLYLYFSGPPKAIQTKHKNNSSS